MKADIVGRGWAFPPEIGVQGGLMLTDERSEIEQAIKIILLTAPGQRVMRPRFGCRIHELVFAPNNVNTAAQARRFVQEALNMWEPRIDIVDIIAGPDPHQGNRLLIEIQYTIKATSDTRSLVFPFYMIGEDPVVEESLLLK
ncbi:MAG: GPW/gp25 family protein [Ardenticatenaceae bacterium]|nr:GPW/gp25 family protein [Ardenticatenaceae bacterium]